MTGIARDAKKGKTSSMRRKGAVDKKKAQNIITRLAVICLAVMLITHRRVIAACITGGPMPETPEWHKKCFGHCCEA